MTPRLTTIDMIACVRKSLFGKSRQVDCKMKFSRKGGTALLQRHLDMEMNTGISCLALAIQPSIEKLVGNIKIIFFWLWGKANTILSPYFPKTLCGNDTKMRGQHWAGPGDKQDPALLLAHFQEVYRGLMFLCGGSTSGWEFGQCSLSVPKFSHLKLG